MKNENWYSGWAGTVGRHVGPARWVDTVGWHGGLAPLAQHGLLLLGRAGPACYSTRPCRPNPFFFQAEPQAKMGGPAYWTGLITPESLPTPTTQCDVKCVIKSVIDRLHTMIILKQNSFVYKPKAFWMLHLK